MKLIASDLDGTLLDEEGVVSEENIAAIQKAIDHGIRFVVATGRSYDAASTPLKQAGITCPIISLNGAVAYTEDKKLIRTIPMDKSVAKQVLGACREADMYLEFFTSNGIYSVSKEYFLEVLVDIMKSANPNVAEADIRKKAELRFQAEPVQFIADYDEIFAVENLEIYKILAFSLDKEKLKNVRTQLAGGAGMAITSSGDINLEFNHQDAQKGIALKHLAESMGIGMADVMALGDNWNDASMLQAAERGVAMGNASDEIKALCSYTTKANYDHGVADAIEEMLQERKNKRQ
ncbi:Cof-type HAD-IIB family hydrolase [Oceanobacillus polygoni]|uniref:Cof subfamily protein (Haloacid dehalogenase superfamily) n=1 Tax=Oceanobacillus polygoni TaxID=1235259 RepID=A0A9X1CAZ3_9BACI|nr:Cof-type HAD-IIB family hydrolase [Oceanobacillus polygoni]MBP2076391.1 Cof subfamily protein (haloacid dehalogenase superfamily) [Oceanobacillus polygoni]